MGRHKKKDGEAKLEYELRYRVHISFDINSSEADRIDAIRKYGEFTAENDNILPIILTGKDGVTEIGHVTIPHYDKKRI